MRHAFVGCLLLVAAACGGGGGAAPTPPAPEVVDLGTVPSTEVTAFVQTFVNWTGQPATLLTDTSTGGYSVAPFQLPLLVQPFEAVDLTLQLMPPGPGPADGMVKVLFQAPNGDLGVTQEFTAIAEPLSLDVDLTPLAFGEVLPGTTKDLTISVENTSVLSPATLSPILLPSALFQVVNPPPVVIAPGTTGDLTIRYAPTGPAATDGNVVINSVGLQAPINVPCTATSGGEEIVDLGTQTFNANGMSQAHIDIGGTGITDLLSVDVPDDAISMMIEGTVTGTSIVGLGEWTGPGGQVYENTQLTGEFLWFDSAEFFVARLPASDRAALKLVQGGGTYTFKLLRMGGNDTSVDVRVIIERRPGPTENVATLDLNVWLADGIDPTAANAATHQDLQDVLDKIKELLGQRGITVGDIDYYDVTNASYDHVTSDAEFRDLLKLSSTAAEVRLNFFFVETALGGGVLGVAGAIDGPKLNGTASSGVMGLWIDNPSANDVDLVGTVAAHEMGHLLGLFHTAESDGTHDRIDDTSDCGSGGCTGDGNPDNDYLMHWSASTGGGAISPAQGTILRSHPLMTEALPTAPLTSKPAASRVGGPIAVHPNWCGTCRHCAKKKAAGGGR